jgi:hypothetical protein
VHGFRLVQIALPSAAPARQLVGPNGAPLSADPSHVALRGRRGTTQLLRPGYDRASGGAVDKYQDMLDGITEINPGDPRVPMGVYQDLVPDPSIISRIPKARGLHEQTEMKDDIVEDAWGSRPMLVSVPLPGGG